MNILKYATFGLGLIVSTQSWALTINSGATDVGTVDVIIAQATLANSGDGTEEAWVESILGYDVSLDSKYSSVGGDWTLVDGELDVYALGLDTDPAYYILKMGDGGLSSGNSHYLYDNFNLLTYAVVDVSEMGLVKNNGTPIIDIMRISHVTEFESTTTLPPTNILEPGTTALLGLGLLGMLTARRRLS